MLSVSMYFPCGSIRAITQLVGAPFVPIRYTFGAGTFKTVEGHLMERVGVFAGDGSREATETELCSSC
ncbi:unnamed protein product [Eruca vesicaria subsp. sativa]|uniref:Uncharacterized protein n=1 Tax=Eruca vesicaria subsp. sativa TaxID=29727 RepID=A0ABC8K4V4_ERUVS|nr:unnamed protein product [Eruca vesicaria subsp. sativa]